MDVSTVRWWKRTVKGDNPDKMNLHNHVRSRQLNTTTDTHHQGWTDSHQSLCQAERYCNNVLDFYPAYRVHHITHEMLRYRKVCVTWVPYMLPQEMKQCWWQVSGSLITFYRTLYKVRSGTCDFFLSPMLKEHLKGHHYKSYKDVQSAVHTWLPKKI